MFEDRTQAGLLLFQKIKKEKIIEKGNTLILGIPRGGVVVAYELAKQAKLPLGVVIVKKIGLPFNSELAIGAVGQSNTVYWDKDLIQRFGISEAQKSILKTEKFKEIKDREEMLGSKSTLNVKGKVVLLVDDGIATGATVLAAEKFLRKQKAKSIILAAPVVAKQTFDQIGKIFDKIVTLQVDSDFYAVGQYFRDFPQVSDEEVAKILKI